MRKRPIAKKFKVLGYDVRVSMASQALSWPAERRAVDLLMLAALSRRFIDATSSPHYVVFDVTLQL
jgi:hypothetical protein